MSPVSRLRQVVAAIGLLLLAPIGGLLAAGQLTAADAGIRGGLLFAGVFVVRAMLGRFGRRLAARPPV